MIHEVKEKVRDDCGHFCSLKGVIPISMLPKTRSGKVLRPVMKNIVNGLAYKFPATIEDPKTLENVHGLIQKWKQDNKIE